MLYGLIYKEGSEAEMLTYYEIQQMSEEDKEIEKGILKRNIRTAEIGIEHMERIKIKDLHRGEVKQ